MRFKIDLLFGCLSSKFWPFCDFLNCHLPPSLQWRPFLTLWCRTIRRGFYLAVVKLPQICRRPPLDQLSSICSETLDMWCKTTFCSRSNSPQPSPVHWLSSSIFPFSVVVLLWWHPSKSPLFSIYTGIKALDWVTHSILGLVKEHDWSRPKLTNKIKLNKAES